MDESSTPIKNLIKKPPGPGGIRAPTDPAAGFGQMPKDQSTPIKNLGRGPGGPPGGPGGPGLPMGNMMDPRSLQTPLNVPVPSGAGQGNTKPEGMGSIFARKEFFGLENTDYISSLVVFALILILSSPMFYSLLRPHSPTLLINMNGQPTPLGSVLAAILGALIYLFIQFFSN